MKKWTIEFRPEYKRTPMSFWVHRHLDHETWTWSTQYNPPLPKAIPCKGFPYLKINALGVNLEFSSIQEAEHFLEVISQKNMPTTTQLSRKRTNNYGPNRHWLSRLPAGLKPWVKRQKIIPVVEAGINEFKTISS